jgi:hypothetical protein
MSKPARSNSWRPEGRRTARYVRDSRGMTCAAPTWAVDDGGPPEPLPWTPGSRSRREWPPAGWHSGGASGVCRSRTSRLVNVADIRALAAAARLDVRARRCTSDVGPASWPQASSKVRVHGYTTDRRERRGVSVRVARCTCDSRLAPDAPSRSGMHLQTRTGPATVGPGSGWHQTHTVGQNSRAPAPAPASRRARRPRGAQQGA